jgi:RNA polymerase sigma factor (sigma-70 family)
MDRLYRGGTSAGQDDAQLLSRFVRDRDEGAFESLVQRHGPMVLGICRRVLRDPRDIEDAFQATFLVLAQRAGSIRNRAVLSSWLYGVAHRVATRCRTEVLRRKSIETQVDGIEFPAACETRPSDELVPILDQELGLLPEKYRAPIVHCYLREQTHDQAAAELKWPVGTVRSRLARGRELLRDRLTRRGWSRADAMLVMTSGLNPRLYCASLPQGLVEATVASAGRFLGGAAGAAPAVAFLSSNLTCQAPSLARGVLTTMAMTKYSWLGSGLAALGLVAGGMGAGAWAVAARGDGKPDDKPGETPAPAVKAIPLSTPRAVEPPPPVPTPQPAGGDVLARLAALERKLDLLLRSLGQTTPVSGAPALAPLTGPEPVPAAHSLPPAAAVEGPAIHPVQPQPAALPGPTPEPQPLTPALAPVPRGLPTAESVSALPPPRSEVGPAVAEVPAPHVAPADPTPAVVEPTQDTPPSVEPRRTDRPMRPRLANRAPIPDDFSRDTAAPRTPAQVSAEWQGAPAMPRTSLRETEVQIEIARRKIERSRQLRSQGAISVREAEEPMDELKLLLARLRGMADDVSELFEQAKASLARLIAELDRAKAQVAMAASTTARNARLNSRKEGMVAPEEVARADAELEAARANQSIREADVQEGHIRLKQLEFRGQRIWSVINDTIAGIPELKEGSGRLR